MEKTNTKNPHELEKTVRHVSGITGNYFEMKFGGDRWCLVVNSFVWGLLFGDLPTATR